MTALGVSFDQLNQWTAFEWAVFAVAFTLAVYLIIAIGRAIGAWAQWRRAMAKYKSLKK